MTTPLPDTEATAAPEPVVLLPQFWTLAGDVRPGDGDGIGIWPLLDRVRAAADAGFTGFGFWMPDLFAYEQGGGDLDALATALRDRGLRHAQFELGVVPWWGDGPERAAADTWRDRALRVVEQLDVPDSHLKCIPEMAGNGVPLERYAEGFAALATASAGVGARLGLEFLPFSDVSTTRGALAVVEAAGHPNGGVVIDAWHVFRGDGDLEAIRELTAEQIVTVELDDADAAVVGELGDDTIDRRRYCGEGAFPLAAFVDAVRSTGYRGSYTVEIISEQNRSLPLPEAARRAYSTSTSLFTL